ncbi:MAG: hypothetical protein PHU14_04600 [Methylovulum sp.]|nr:hypothetical protein [Methylovulum sp.]
MHDWTLVSILVEWAKGMITLTFISYKLGHVCLSAEGLTRLVIPKYDEWGESVSVNNVYGPIRLDDGSYRLELAIQSGDTIVLEAKSIQMPVITTE